MTDEGEQNRRKTRRSLFGSARPSDTDEWLKGLENKVMEEKMRKWNFDFRSGRPLKEPGAESPSSSHVYEAVDEREVPEFYRTKTVRATPSRPATAALEVSPRKPRLKVSESLKVVEKSVVKIEVEQSGGAEMVSPRKGKRLRKAKSMESTPRKRKKPGEEQEQDE